MTDTTGIRSVLSKEALIYLISVSFKIQMSVCGASRGRTCVFYGMVSIREQEVHNERKRQKRCDHGV